MNVPPSKFSNIYIRCSNKQESFLSNNQILLRALARLDQISIGESIEKPGQSATMVVDGMELYIPLGGLVDLGQEKHRMEKRISEINRLIIGINSKLSNEKFITRAPEHIVEKERLNLSKLSEELDKVTANMEMLQ